MVIGYGNLERGDDGVAFHVVNRLRRALGRAPLGDADTGLQDLGADTDAVFIRQLVPELAVEAAAYDRLVFVDAHVPSLGQAVACARILPEARLSAFSHLMAPAAFLWLAQAVGGRAPAGFLVSLRGRCFDPVRGLSPQTAGLVNRAAARIRRLLSVTPEM